MAAVYDIRVTEGYDYSESFTFNDSNGDPKDLSSYTFDCDFKDVLADPAIGSFVVNTAQAANGILILSLNKTTLSALMDAGVRDYYDLLQINGTTYTQLMVGRVEVGVGISNGS